jgi:hypothetical protein
MAWKEVSSEVPRQSGKNNITVTLSGATRRKIRTPSDLDKHITVKFIYSKKKSALWLKQQ